MRSAFRLLCALSSSLWASETVAVLGCPREDGATTALSLALSDSLAARQQALPELRLVDKGDVVRIVREQAVRVEGALAAAKVLKLGSYLDASRLVAGSYRCGDGECLVRVRLYGTLTGDLEGTDTLRLPCDPAVLRLDAQVLEPSPEPRVAVAVAEVAAPRPGRGEPPLVLEGCRFGEEGAHCRGWIRNPAGVAVRLLREGSRFAYDNGLRGPLGRWEVAGSDDPQERDSEGLVRLDFDVGISLLHSGPREFRFFQLRYRVGDELWEWNAIPKTLRDR